MKHLPKALIVLMLASLVFGFCAPMCVADKGTGTINDPSSPGQTGGHGDGSILPAYVRAKPKAQAGDSAWDELKDAPKYFIAYDHGMPVYTIPATGPVYVDGAWKMKYYGVTQQTALNVLNIVSYETFWRSGQFSGVVPTLIGSIPIGDPGGANGQ